MLVVTDHAVERFIQRWRPGMPFADARELLEELAARAGATRRKTLPGDARVYLALTDEGEQITLAVRGDVVVTVLDAHASEVAQSHELEEQEMRIQALEEEKARREAARIRERTEKQQAVARKTIDDWKAGATLSKKAREAACVAAGLRFEDVARVKIEGGRYDGVCIEVRPGDGIDAIVRRMEAALKAREG